MYLLAYRLQGPLDYKGHAVIDLLHPTHSSALSILSRGSLVRQGFLPLCSLLYPQHIE